MFDDKVLTPEQLAKEAERIVAYPSTLLPEQARAYRNTDRYLLAEGLLALRAQLEHATMVADDALAENGTLTQERDAAMARERALAKLARKALEKWGSWHEPRECGARACLGCELMGAIAAVAPEVTP